MIRIVNYLAGPGGGSSGGGGGFGPTSPLPSVLLQLLLRIAESLKTMSNYMVSFLSREVDMSVLDDLLPISIGTISVLELLFGVGVFGVLVALLATFFVRLLH